MHKYLEGLKFLTFFSFFLLISSSKAIMETEDTTEKSKNLILRKGILHWGNSQFQCTWGRNGITDKKKEGDWMTPVGSFHFLTVFYRRDKLKNPPKTSLALWPLEPTDGWSDDPTDPHYNRKVKLVSETFHYPYSHEKMYRPDHIYDLGIVVDYNSPEGPKSSVPGLGSAIFIHLRRDNKEDGFTAGCVALDLKDLLQVVEEATPESCLIVEP